MTVPRRREYVYENSVDFNASDNAEFKSCDTCARGIVTKNGVICGDSLALVCKPGLLETPKHYKNWEDNIESND